jgi:hypothetical protein
LLLIVQFAVNCRAVPRVGEKVKKKKKKEKKKEKRGLRGRALSACIRELKSDKCQILAIIEFFCFFDFQYF